MHYGTSKARADIDSRKADKLAELSIEADSIPFYEPENIDGSNVSLRIDENYEALKCDLIDTQAAIKGVIESTSHDMG